MCEMEIAKEEERKKETGTIFESKMTKNFSD